jgi:uncharacterized membrane protein
MKTEKITKEKIYGAVCYLLGPLTGIFFLVIEKRNDFIRFHAMQSTVLFGAIILFHIVLGIMPLIGWLAKVLMSPVIVLVSFILWLFLMWRAFIGDKYKLPYFGDIAEKQLNSLK